MGVGEIGQTNRKGGECSQLGPEMMIPSQLRVPLGESRKKGEGGVAIKS